MSDSRVSANKRYASVPGKTDSGSRSSSSSNIKETPKKNLTSTPASASSASSAAAATAATLATATAPPAPVLAPSHADTHKSAFTTNVIESSSKQFVENQPPSDSLQTFSGGDIASDSPIAVQFFANFHQICVITAILPLVTLFTCFVTAYVFQYDEVHETHCRVYNIVPSISAITGVSPQRYFWRFSIALHLGPRLPIAFIYKNYYRFMLDKLRKDRPEKIGKMDQVVTLILLLNIIEIASLGGVTYISNRENYPIHERIFITFMICSLCHMLATIKLNGVIHEDHTELSQRQRDSIKWKKILFAMSILSTVGLLIFFAKHRFYCHDLAFSWFAFFEYLIAMANMFFHFTVVWDFDTLSMIVVEGPRSKITEMFQKTKID